MELQVLKLDVDFYVIGDTHFGHKKIISLCSRPFDSVDEMDYKMIEEWNKTVKKDDIVIHIGDVALAKTKKIEWILSQLNGRKWLIRGNHDYSNSVTKWGNIGFERVLTKTKDPHEFVIVEHENEQYALSHYYLPKEMGYKNIHGHVHNNTDGLDKKVYACASVECINYKPILFSEIIKRFEAA
ncbi:metallophosphoesterase [Bacillus cereus]|uniref:metallophosphoesterase n=1 Tax=Bacillus cereus TaxID=1396 RepID=UPI000B4B31DA|nr:metallophosphoesterase [Bacillus cereus]